MTVITPTKSRLYYEHGLNADGALVHISDAERGGQYSCAGCGMRLVAVLGNKRPRRFRHHKATDRENCSMEYAIRILENISATYRHGLNADGALVHISDAEQGAQYFCAGCGKRLIKVFGDKRPRRFRHYATADGAACAPRSAIFRMEKLAVIAGWRAAKANGWEYPIVAPCESCQTDMRVLDATDFDHAGDESELVEGTRAYAAFRGDILADGARRMIFVIWPDVVFWGGRAPMAIKIGMFNTTGRAGALCRRAGFEFLMTTTRLDDEAIVEDMSRRVKVYADGRVCEPCRKTADLIVRRLQEEERQARVRGEPIDGDGTAANGRHSGVAQTLTEMGHSQNNRYFFRLASKIETSAKARVRNASARMKNAVRVRNAAKKHRQAVGDSQGWTCPYCGRDVSGRVGVIDHKIPVSRGGTSEPDNLAILCRSCNSSKRDRTPEEYRAYRTERARSHARHNGIRQAVGDSQGWRCPRCGRDVSGQKGVIHLEFPVSWESELDNLVILCRRCHFSQRDRTQ